MGFDEQPLRGDRLSSSVSIGIDLGGTKVRAGRVGPHGEIQSTLQIPTRSVGMDLVARLADLVRSLDPDDDAAAVAVSVAGRLSRDGSRVSQAVNLGLVDFPLACELERASGRRVALINDAHATLLAEVRLGAARSFDDVVLISLGTGVGGAILSGGRLVTGSHGNAGEIGHTVVETGGRACGCGGSGCLDVYGSGPALVRFANERSRDSSFSSGQDVTRRAMAGDVSATRAIDTLAQWVAMGLADAVAVVDPALILVGGGLAHAGDVVLRPIEMALDAELERRHVTAHPTVGAGELGWRAPILGAVVAGGMEAS